MGLWMLLGYAFQAVGLEYTTAQRSGFLLYLNVKFVPFFSWALFGREISVATWTSAAMALLGTALLAYDYENQTIGLNGGDAWSIAAAAASAMFILRLEKASSAVPNDAAAVFNAASLWVVCVGSAFWFALDANANSNTGDSVLNLINPILISDALDIMTHHPWEMLYLGGVTTAFCNYIQTIGQRGVSAERASIIYALDPVWGAGFASVLLGEQLGGWQGYLGASLITGAAIAVNVMNVSSNGNIDDSGLEENVLKVE